VTTKLDVVTTVVSGSALVGPEVRNTETTGVYVNAGENTFVMDVLAGELVENVS